MSMTFSQVNNALMSLMWIPLNKSDVNFTAIFPRMVEYAELRIYREMDFPATKTSQVATLTAGSAGRAVTVPASIVVLEAVNVITPVTAVTANTGKRNPLRRVSPETLNYLWPSAASTGLPVVCALMGSGTTSAPATSAYSLQIAPSPSSAFTAEFVGTVRPAPLTEANATTFLTQNMPDMFISACMVFGCGYQRDYGAQANDPERAMSWEKLYGQQRDALNIETLRQKYRSADWTAVTPSQLTNQPLDLVRTGGG